MAVSAVAVNEPLDDAFNDLLNRIRSYNPFVDLDRLKSAYELGKKAHLGQFRASGESYFSHPIAVGYLLADMHLDTDTIIHIKTIKDMMKIFLFTYQVGKNM